MGKNKKRKLSQLIQDEAAHDGKPSHDVGVGSTVAHLQASELHNQQRQDTAQDANDDDAEGWTVVGKGGKKRKTNNYPALVYNELHNQQSSIKIQDLQTLILYCIADGPSPQWVSIRHHSGVKKAVVLFVPGLERRMFDGSVRLDTVGNTDQDTELSNATSSPAKDEVMQNVPSTIAVQHANGISRPFASSDDYLPVRLAAENLPEPLQPLAACFEYLWPVKAPGDDRLSKVYSPLHAMLNANIPKSREQKEAEKAIKGAKPVNGPHWQNKRTPITTFTSTKEQLQDDDYVLHPVWFTTEAERAAEVKRREAATQTAERGWVDSQVANLEAGFVPDNDVDDGSLNAGRTILAMDCEMCKVDGDDAALTRISLVGWDGEVVVDELVKPDKPIFDYLTQFSGITAESLDPVTTTLADIQKRLLDILTPQTILVGHSLNFDLVALKLTHPFVIDTSILYQHPRGPPLKSSLKWLAQKYLAREIQKGHGSVGHDSVEDSRACLDLVKMKCEKGPDWGSSATNQETIFKRLARTTLNGHPSLTKGIHGKIGAIIDHGAPEKNFGRMATYNIGCNTDAEVVEGVKRAVIGHPDGAVIPGGGVDFTWARMRELEALRGWSNNHGFDIIQMDSPSSANGDAEPSPSELGKKVASTVSLIQEVHASMPPCTLLVVYSGTGDPRDLARLQKVQRTFKKEYKTEKWDQLSVKWTDTEEQALKQACRKAREGLGFVTIT
ncbi:MAG: hypothetical protein Q9181_005482 [Wetmoreana brouardii]